MLGAPGGGGTPGASASPGVLGEVARLLGALAVVIGLAFAARWWLQRTGLAKSATGGAFEVLARHSIGRGQQVLVARFGPRLLCVQQTRDGLRTLSELTDPAEVAGVLADARGMRGQSVVRATGGGGAHAGTEEIRTVDMRRGKERGP